MLETVRQTLADIHPLLVPAAGLLALVLIAWLINVVARAWIIRIAHRLAERTATTWDDQFVRFSVIRRATQLLPAIVIYQGVLLVPGIPEDATTVIRNATLALMVIIAILAVNAALSAANAIYEQRPESRKTPIKGYVQVAKIVLFCVGAIVVVSALLDKSPLILLSGFGALTAVLLLVFKDTILSLVASVQLSSQDMVRVGDWIEMPKFDADGDVIDVALHTVRVQNWDKTITTIPTHRLISESFRNWRGMSESGGRRIKRSLLIDMASVRFLTPEEASNFRRFALLSDYINRKQQELADYNAGLALPTDDDVNLRRLTNLGTFRAYVFNYLKNHRSIRQDMTLLVRQLPPQPAGIPIEIYCFTNTTKWAEYEAIQADLFDNLLAILHQFGLRAYQQPSGFDLAGLGGELGGPSLPALSPVNE